MKVTVGVAAFLFAAHESAAFQPGSSFLSRNAVRRATPPKSVLRGSELEETEGVSLGDVLTSVLPLAAVVAAGAAPAFIAPDDAAASAVAPEKNYFPPYIYRDYRTGYLKTLAKAGGYFPAEKGENWDGQNLMSGGSTRTDWGGLQARNADFRAVFGKSSLFTDMDVTGSKFDGAYLGKTKWKGTNVQGVSFERANFENSDLTGIKNFDKAKSLFEANLTGAKLDDDVKSKICSRKDADSMFGLDCGSGAKSFTAPWKRSDLVKGEMIDLTLDDHKVPDADS
uniref:Pentapeptide repeat protein n=1 Tax=Chromera velia CCMP2878 TaxID=1169474 RepID=A0A0G4HQ95_9ALVE|mmetsp:Transcript_42226/g.83328  ORF Transcript_42226/g.83328 Transcript_42226/m.83328 type:complete len:282 (-) Transcript_42226:905-1750(-)|eukprot:Cvel_7928.t1-p1 / transcript=Cvel_7928.t1 / gene=Cvel_7928 / organism=Chromera_velia_CCMP2878 / gene_product=hypothetical protein / transcript_product=hypothetical protein / location=Cvel_scaffold425:45293-46135(-) / protein_length=281 / sequence_SO=supercontig / SO=protein_coding / is_pseudo=false